MMRGVATPQLWLVSLIPHMLYEGHPELLSLVIHSFIIYGALEALSMDFQSLVWTGLQLPVLGHHGDLQHLPGFQGLLSPNQGSKVPGNLFWTSAGACGPKVHSWHRKSLEISCRITRSDNRPT